mmetsp:Transcript_25698/g.74335  ORF Transcript_25698/g.74335 Transcript_25698/m.74335 type:complete len:94 (-) Transcript_25698:307-588(-)
MPSAITGTCISQQQSKRAKPQRHMPNTNSERFNTMTRPIQNGISSPRASEHNIKLMILIRRISSGRAVPAPSAELATRCKFGLSCGLSVLLSP